MRKLIGLVTMVALASCVAPPPKSAPPPPRPAPQPMALPAPPPQLDWRDVPLTPGHWTWRGGAGQPSLAQFGMPGASAILALRCDASRAVMIFSRSGSLGTATGSITVTTSFGAFTVPARDGGGAPPAILGELAARDPRLDQMAFSRGRFLVDIPSQPRLVVPSWPQVARVIEDCRG